MDRRELVGPALGVVGIITGSFALLSEHTGFGWVAFVLLTSSVAVGALAARQHLQLRRESDSARHEMDALRVEHARECTARSEAEKRLSSRLQLTAMRQTPDAAQLTDQESGLYSEAYFTVALAARIASARRNLNPLAVVVLEPVQGLLSGAPNPAAVPTVSNHITATVREADTVCRLIDGSYSLILDDTDENGAIWTVERIRRALATTDDAITVWAGVACYPAHGLTTEEILDRADVALDAAREWRQDRIEVANADS